jgi:hypothetical protein
MPERPGKPGDPSNFIGRQSEPTAPRGATVPMLLHPLEAALIHRLRGLGFGRLEKVEVQNGLPVGYEREVEKVRLDKEAGRDA